MRELFRPNTSVHSEQSKEIGEDVIIPDNELVKESNLSEGEFGYFKYITIDGIRYILYIQHAKENIDGEAEIHFSLSDSMANPITNAGLEVFGRVATEIEKMYQEVSKEVHIAQFKILAAKDSHSLLEEQRVRKLNQEDLLGLEGFRYLDVDLGVNVEIRGQMVSVIVEGIEHKIFNLRPQLIDDLERISDQLNAQWLVPELIRYLNRGVGNDQAILEKELQRLKLYQFYFQKRFPRFTFNSKVTTGSDGKRSIEFEKDETGRPFLLVYTNLEAKSGVMS